MFIAAYCTREHSKMQPAIFAPVFCLLLASAAALSNLQNTDLHKNIRCVCHAVSGCYFLQNCARYSVNFRYWQSAGSPVLNVDDLPNEESYRACITNDNCILHTINNYIQQHGEVDCNCDGVFNAEDMLAIHFDACQNMTAIPNLARRQWRYGNCAGESMSMPPGTCIPEAV